MKTIRIALVLALVAACGAHHDAEPARRRGKARPSKIGIL